MDDILPFKTQFGQIYNTANSDFPGFVSVRLSTPTTRTNPGQPRKSETNRKRQERSLRKLKQRCVTFISVNIRLTTVPIPFAAFSYNQSAHSCFKTDTSPSIDSLSQNSCADHDVPAGSARQSSDRSKTVSDCRNGSTCEKCGFILWRNGFVCLILVHRCSPRHSAGPPVRHVEPLFFPSTKTNKRECCTPLAGVLLRLRSVFVTESKTRKIRICDIVYLSKLSL